MSKYRATWQQEDLMEFALSHTVRYRDPLNKKRFAIPYKTADKARDKMTQLKRDGVKEIEITKDILRGKFKESNLSERYSVKFSYSKGGKIANAYYDDKEDADKFVKSVIAKGGKAIMTTEDIDESIKQIAESMITEAMNPAQIKKLKDTWAQIKTMTPEKTKTLNNFLDKYSTDTLMQLAQAGINFVSNMARSVAGKRKVGDMKHAGSMKEEKMTDSEKMATMRTRQMVLQTKLKDLDVGDPKDKTPIEITKNDLENIQMKMDQLKQKQARTETKEHPAKKIYEYLIARLIKGKK